MYGFCYSHMWQLFGIIEYEVRSHFLLESDEGAESYYFSISVGNGSSLLREFWSTSNDSRSNIFLAILMQREQLEITHHHVISQFSTKLPTSVSWTTAGKSLLWETVM